MKRLGPLITAFALLATSSAHAGPVAEFEASFREMYGIYRIALFQTNAGEHAESFTAVTDLSDQLAALAEIWGEDPPPQYQDDHLWGATIDTARALVGTANDQVAAHELSEAHATLEGLRDLFGELHARNGIETFSDRMNAYHAAMEHFLSADPSDTEADMMGMIREQAAVLAYLARDVLATPPVGASGNPEYATLSADFETSVRNLLDAARSGDETQLRAAAEKLKPAYARLFLKFG